MTMLSSIWCRRTIVCCGCIDQLLMEAGLSEWCYIWLFAGVHAPAAPQAALPAAASPTKRAPVDPLEELFATTPAAQPAAQGAFASYDAPAAVPPAAGTTALPGVQQVHTPVASVGSAGLSIAPLAGMPAASGHFGAVGLQQGPQGSVGSLGFTSVGSWAPGSLHPAASAGSLGSTGLFDTHAVAAAPGAAAGGGALGFDDSAFGPVDDWRVLGDVQQWHRALLTKEKVSAGSGEGLCR